jgi:hypothetical protein
MTAAVWVRGVARWRGEEGVPKPALLPPKLRRRTSPLTRAVAEVLDRLALQTGLDLAAVPTVHASSMGEIGTTVGLLAMMQEDDGALSPTRFHNSVHNTAGGYVSIATGNRALCTALAGGPQTVAIGLLEAIGVICAGSGEVALVVAEEALPEALGGPGHESLAVAFHLASSGGAPGHLRLDAPRLRSVPDVPTLPPSLTANPCAPAWALADALAARRGGLVGLEQGQVVGSSGLCTQIIVPATEIA